MSVAAAGQEQLLSEAVTVTLPEETADKTDLLLTKGCYVQEALCRSASP
jgi:hypothetical protein